MQKIPLKMCVHALTQTLAHSRLYAHTVFTLTQIHMHIWEDPAIIQNDTFISGKMCGLVGNLI
jgi:hypothetical protein